MKTTLRILHVGQAPSDVEKARGTLEAEGFACDFHRVETAADFVFALEKGGFDLILADVSRPRFDGLSALAIAREISPDTPFVNFSGALDDETAKTLLEHGATDYVLKRCLFTKISCNTRAPTDGRIAAKDACRR
jgi:CheY-like chemotaxis protein